MNKVLITFILLLIIVLMVSDGSKDTFAEVPPPSGDITGSTTRILKGHHLILPRVDKRTDKVVEEKLTGAQLDNIKQLSFLSDVAGIMKSHPKIVEDKPYIRMKEIFLVEGVNKLPLYTKDKLLSFWVLPKWKITLSPNSVAEYKDGASANFVIPNECSPKLFIQLDPTIYQSYKAEYINDTDGMCKESMVGYSQEIPPVTPVVGALISSMFSI